MGDVDQDILFFIAAHEVVTADQLAALLQITSDDTTTRLDQLKHQRLLTRVELSSQLPAAYRITHDGTDQVDPALPPLSSLDWRRYRHEIAVAWLWATARRGHLGTLRQVLSRREMQAADTTLRSQALLNTTEATFKNQSATEDQLDSRHAYPDLGLVQADGGWATLDVVLTLPDPQQLNVMLGHYHHDQLIRGQLFIVEHDPQIAQAITATADQLGHSDRVDIKPLTPNGIHGT